MAHDHVSRSVEGQSAGSKLFIFIMLLGETWQVDIGHRTLGAHEDHNECFLIRVVAQCPQPSLHIVKGEIFHDGADSARGRFRRIG